LCHTTRSAVDKRAIAHIDPDRSANQSTDLSVVAPAAGRAPVRTLARRDLAGHDLLSAMVDRHYLLLGRQSHFFMPGPTVLDQADIPIGLYPTTLHRLMATVFENNLVGPQGYSVFVIDDRVRPYLGIDYHDIPAIGEQVHLIRAPDQRDRALTVQVNFRQEQLALRQLGGHPFFGKKPVPFLLELPGPWSTPSRA